MKQMSWRRYDFAPEEHEDSLREVVEAIRARRNLDARALGRILARHPKNGAGFFSKSEIIAGYRYFAAHHAWDDEASFLEKVRMKPVRSLSGVTPVTILTKPYPCPGKCVFCPNDVRMPKSYLSREPGAQRAANHQFDPYEQTLARLLALHQIGHPADKIELIVLGGTFSSYPLDYQIWFIKRSFDAMNDFGDGARALPDPPLERLDFERLETTVDGRLGNSYNRVVSEFARDQDHGGRYSGGERATWPELFDVHRLNEHGRTRCVGLSVETRPDHVTVDEVVRLRRLGATKVQLGYQSLSDDVLALNQRGHTVAQARTATRLLRGAGFKIQAHWMPNLYGSTPEDDIVDYRRIFEDQDFRPDELKLYPCSLIESAELMVHYEAGRYRPYEHDELMRVVTACLSATPGYCRLSRVIRDIPGDDILVGSKVTNLRALAEDKMRRDSMPLTDIRAREIRSTRVDDKRLCLSDIRYESSVGEERFIQFVTEDDRLAGFCRLLLPNRRSHVAELARDAIIRELHVYGSAVAIGESDAAKPQHSGLGRRLIDRAVEIATASGYRSLAVIASVGTREYYRRRGFRDGWLYQHRRLTLANQQRPVSRGSMTGKPARAGAWKAADESGDSGSERNHRSHAKRGDRSTDEQDKKSQINQTRATS